MKLTKDKLRQIIKEELEELMSVKEVGSWKTKPLVRNIDIHLRNEPRQPPLPPEKPILSPELNDLITKLKHFKDPESKAGSPLASTWALSRALDGNQDAKKQFRPDPFNMPGNYKLEDVMNTAGLSNEEKELIRNSLFNKK